MIKLFTQQISFATSTQQQRDQRSLEDQLNEFLKDPRILPQETELQVFDNGGNQYFTILLDYNFKQGG